jgi:hypothetical protein
MRPANGACAISADRAALVAAQRHELDHLVAGLQAEARQCVQLCLRECGHGLGGARRIAPVQRQPAVLVFDQHAGVAMGEALGLLQRMQAVGHVGGSNGHRDVGRTQWWPCRPAAGRRKGANRHRAVRAGGR